MHHLPALLGAVCWPSKNLASYVATPRAANDVWRTLAVPGAMLHALPILITATLHHAFVSGLPRAAAALLLQLLSYGGMLLVVQRLARSLSLPLNASMCRNVGTLVVAPMWLAGILGLLPEHHWPVVLTVVRALAYTYGPMLAYQAVRLTLPQSGGRKAAADSFVLLLAALFSIVYALLHTLCAGLARLVWLGG